jgi:hypothetical protein
MLPAVEDTFLQREKDLNIHAYIACQRMLLLPCSLKRLRGI